MLAVESLPFFYVALVLLACGSGLLKPNISTIVGNLYRDRPELRDAGFNIYYMGINLGGFIAPIAVAWFRAHYGWSVAFGSAAVAMLLSLVTFVAGRRQIERAAQRVPVTSEQARAVGAHEARQRTVALLVVCAIAAVFWLAFFQNGFTLTLWARDNTATSIAPEIFRSVEPLGVIVFSAIVVAVWGRLRARGAEPSTPSKMLFGDRARGGSLRPDGGCRACRRRHGTRVAAWWLVAAYLIVAIGEICMSPMGLSLVNRVAPPRSRGLMMGAWFVSLSAGGYLSGSIGSYWDRMPHSRFFLLVVGILAMAALLLAAVLPRIRAVLHRVEQIEAAHSAP